MTLLRIQRPDTRNARFPKDAGNESPQCGRRGCGKCHPRTHDPRGRRPLLPGSRHGRQTKSHGGGKRVTSRDTSWHTQTKKKPRFLGAVSAAIDEARTRRRNQGKHGKIRHLLLSTNPHRDKSRDKTPKKKVNLPNIMHQPQHGRFLKPWSIFHRPS